MQTQYKARSSSTPHENNNLLGLYILDARLHRKYQKWIIHRKLRVRTSEREGKLSNPRGRAARRTQDGLNWHYSATVGSSELLDPTTGEKYGEGPNECALVVLKDKKTVWAVMRVDGGDGYFTKPFISALSSDGGVT